MLKKIMLVIGGALLSLVVLVGIVVYWAQAFSPSESEFRRLSSTTPSDLVYLQSAVPTARGKILAVVTSVRELGATGKPTGYELSELSRAYWVFSVNGFDVDIASPEGGEPYAVLDKEDMGAYDYAFLNDSVAQEKTKNTLKLSNAHAEDYQAIYFVGGKGAMFDFPDNADIHRLVTSFVAEKKIIAAVCHGPSALVNVMRADGEWLLANKRVSAFTNSEELLLIPEAERIFPFLLQSKLEQRGAKVIAGSDYLEQVSVDSGLITGQNPWSVWRLAEETIRQLGYEPVPRSITSEEQSVALLNVYQKQGLEKAEQTVLNTQGDYSGHLVLMHAMVAFMKGELLDGVALMMLADSLKP